MSSEPMPDCQHIWDLRHQIDFPADIFWVKVCKICRAIDGEDLGQQIAPLIAAAERANSEAAVAITTARETRVWAERIAEQVTP